MVAGVFNYRSWHSMRKARRYNSGFTLLEIMMVVFIVGLLAAIVVPSFIKARTQSRTSACINHLRLIQSAKDQYALESNQSETVTPVAADISLYFKTAQLSGGLPTEPQGGAYAINTIDASPTCDQSGHTL